MIKFKIKILDLITNTIFNIIIYYISFIRTFLNLNSMCISVYCFIYLHYVEIPTLLYVLTFLGREICIF